MRILSRSVVLILMLLSVACDRSLNTPIWHDLDGNSIKLSDYKGRWVLINYWAIWCAPCKKEIPAFNELMRKYPDKVVVLGVNFDTVSKEMTRESVEKLQIEFVVLQEDPKYALKLEKKLQVLPSTVVFNPEGELETILVGEQTLGELIRIIQ